jgi:hypothetical protein
MPSAAETLGSGKPPLGASLAEGVRYLSADQELSFSLYRRYVFPLDGMNYWIKVPSAQGSIPTPGILPQPGLVSQTMKDGEAIQVSPGGIGSAPGVTAGLYAGIVGGTITNPLSAADQGLTVAEPLFVDFTGPAYHYATHTTIELLPGHSINIPSYCTSGAWVCAATGGHQFSSVLLLTVPSVTLPTDVQVKGSFHYSSLINQDEDATFDSNTIIFSSLSEIQAFNQVGPDYLYICHYEPPGNISGDLTFAFGSRGRLYEQADLYHYQGTALRSRHFNMIIDDVNNFNPTLTVSNSLPIWLNMPNYVPPYPGFVCPLPLYPSYLVDDNLPPPFGSIHIEGTECIELGSSFGPRLEQSQLVKERVRVHLYGADNLMANNFVAFVEQYSLDWMKLGLSDSPAIKDIKLPASEFKILAMRKQIDFNINYRQWTIRDEYRQFIEHVRVQLLPQWLKDPTAPSSDWGTIGAP